MFKQSALLIGTLLLAGPGASTPANPRSSSNSVPRRSLSKTAPVGHAETRWLLPDLLGRGTGGMFLEISRFDTDFLFSNGLSAGLGSNDIGLDRGSAAAADGWSSSSVSARRDAGAGEPVVPLEQQEPARTQVRRGLVREVDPVGIHRRRRIERPRAGGRHRFLPARHERGQRSAGQLPRRSHAQRVLPAQHTQLPEEHRDRGDADLRERRPRGGGGAAAGPTQGPAPIGEAAGGGHGGGSAAGCSRASSPA